MKLFPIISFVFYVLLFFYSGEGSPQLQSALYEVKETDILGVHLKTATYSFNFTDDLYLYKPHVCPASDCDVPNSVEYCVCDFTTINGQCGKGVLSNDSSDCTCNSSSYCSSADWTDVQIDSNITDQATAQHIKQYRFFLNDTCSGVKVSVSKNFGEMFFHMSTEGPARPSNSAWNIIDSSQNIVFYVCPSSQFFKRGTYFLSLYAVYDSQFQLLLESLEVPSIPPDPIVSSCDPVEMPPDDTHQCLEDGIPFRGSIVDGFGGYFVFVVFGCQKVFLHVTAIGMGADVELYVGIDDKLFPAGAKADYGSYLAGDDYMLLTVCPEKSNMTTIYIGVQPTQSGLDMTDFWMYGKVLNDTSHWKPTRIDLVSPYEASWLMLSSAKYYFPPESGLQGIDAQLLCESFKRNCKEMWFTFPAEDANPFFPVPVALKTLNRVGKAFSLIGGNLTLPIKPASSNQFVLQILVSYSIDGSQVTIVNEEWLSNATTLFTGFFGSLSGEAVLLSTQANQSFPVCHYANFQETTQLITDTFTKFDTAVGSVALNSIRYQIDSITFRDSYFACIQLVDDLLEYVGSDTGVKDTQACFFTPDQGEYYGDPCCYSQAAWIETCEPRPENVTVDRFDLSPTEVKSRCKNAGCTTTYLDDYVTAQKAFLEGSCYVSTADAQKDILSVRQVHQDCKSSFDLPECYADSDCIYQSQNYTCNLLTHECQVPYQIQESSFLECLTIYMDSSQEYYIRTKYNMTARKKHVTDTSLVSLFSDTQNFVTEWLSHVTTTDCIKPLGNMDLAARSHFVWEYLDYACPVEGGCTAVLCEDTSCQLLESNCDLCGMSYWKEVDSEISECSSRVQCNWDSNLCDGLNFTECQTQCDAGPSLFCGLCDSNTTSCVGFPLTQADCLATTVCVLPNGSYAFNLTDFECASFGQCDQLCPKCVTDPLLSRSACNSPADDEITCELNGGNYDTTWGCEIPANNQSVCESGGYIWVQCEDYSVDSCTGYDAQYLSCVVDYVEECSDQPTCEINGKCSNHDLLVNLDGDKLFFGACAIPRYEPEGAYTAGTSQYPYCDPNQGLYPNECIDYSLSQKDCFGYWRYPEYTQDNCEAYLGCLDNAGEYNMFSPKTEDNCTSDYNKGRWEQFFKWKPAHWITGINQPLQWIGTAVVSQYQWDETLDFDTVRADFYLGASQDFALQSKSAVLCQHQQTKDSLSAVVCACTDSAESNCFYSDLSVQTAQAQICAAQVGDVDSTTAVFTYWEESVEIDCSSLFFSQISAANYRNTKQEKLSANFIPFIVTPDYAIFNDKGGAAGILLSDGFQITVAGTGTVHIAEVCIEVDLTRKSSDKYHVKDFVLLENDFKKFHPLGLEIVEKEDYFKKANATITYFCANITNLKDTTNLFAALRVDDYENQQKLDKESLVVADTLAALFLLPSLLAVLKLLHYMYIIKYLHQPFMLEYPLMIFLGLFVIVRTIYFFLVASGFDSIVMDYVLVALPTFFYFTAFSIIVILWAVVSMKHFSIDERSFKKTIYTSVIGINSFLYLIFIAIVIAFDQSKEQSESDCSGRDSSDSASSLRKTISILYSAILVAVSLIISILYVVFGWKVRSSLSVDDSKGQRTKLFIVTGVCSAAFLLHSGFILAISLLNEPNLYFSFVGLVVTELFPVLFLIVWLHLHQRTQTSSSHSSGTRPSKQPTVKTKSSSGSVELADVSLSRQSDI